MRDWSQQLKGDWLDGGAVERDRCVALIRERTQEIGQLRGGARILLVADDPIATAAGVAAVLGAGRPVRLFLGSPAWSQADREIVARDVAPERIWGTINLPNAEPEQPTERGLEPINEPQIFIPTGGTTGGVKFARHTGGTLAAAGEGLSAWLGGGPVHSLCFLPLFHVSGLMQVVRAWVSSGSVAFFSWPEIAVGVLPDSPVANSRAGAAVTSLVPTQLARLLPSPRAVEWLRGFRAVFLGGAAPWAELMSDARRLGIPLAPCYGMTETAAQVAAGRPEAFLTEGSTACEVLPHARVDLVGREKLIRIRAGSLFHGYWPEPACVLEDHETADRGEIDKKGRLLVLGRIDALINSGGEKIDPAVVEAAIRATGCARDVAVCGVSDEKWGEAVMAILVGTEPGVEARLRSELKRRLAQHEVPRRFLHVPEIPRTPAGKVDRQALTRLAAAGDCGE